MSKKTMLLILGATRVGDTIHTIPFLKHACKDYRVHWVHGSYGRQAAEFVRSEVEGMDVSLTCKEDKGLPMQGIPDCMDFLNTNLAMKDTIDYDAYVPSKDLEKTGYPELVCFGVLDAYHEVCGIRFNRLKDSIVRLINDPPQGDHVVVQPQTISPWKTVQSFTELDSHVFGDSTIYNVGTPEEHPLNGPNVQVTNGAHFCEVARLVRSARLVVALHSAVACLAYYLGTPLICVSFGSGFYPFEQGRPNNTMLIQPSKQRLLEVISDYMTSPRKRMEPEDIE